MGTHDHALLPPSSASIWRYCSGWPIMNQAYPELESTPEAEEGEASHWIAEQMIDKGVRGFTCKTSKFVDTQAPNGVVITDEIAEGAQLYAETVVDRCRSVRVFGGTGFGVEARLQMPDIHEQNWGTCDTYIYSPKGLDIYDYKFGHLFVSEYENWQLIDYYVGVCDLLQIDGIADQNLPVRLHVIQPRAYRSDGPVRTWETTGGALRGYVNQLRTAAEKALSEHAEFTAGRHCKYCPGRHACPSVRESGWALYDHATSPLPQELSPAETGIMLMFVREAIARLQAIETGLDEQVRHLVRSGRSVPGYVVEPTYGRKSWQSTPAEVIRMAQLVGVNVAKPGVLTPNQAVKAGMDPDVVEALTETKRTGVRVVPDTSNKAKRLFS